MPRGTYRPIDRSEQHRRELTPQQVTVLRLLAEGLTAVTIGARLGGLTENTIKRHLRLVYARLGAHNAPHAVNLAFRRGVLGREDASTSTSDGTLGRVVDDQHRRIRGYRDLSSDELAVMNELKSAEVEVANLWRRVRDDAGGDPRWLDVARLHLQEAFTALVRSVARPADPFDGEPVVAEVEADASDASHAEAS